MQTPRREAYSETDPIGVTHHSRGYLPHIEGKVVVQHVTFHLADSLPAKLHGQLHDELKSLCERDREAERRKRIERWLDAGHGSCILGEAASARMMCETLTHFDGVRYELHAWVVMPNHVHALLQTMEEWTVRQVGASWKKYSARRIRELQGLGQANAYPADIPVWHRELWDRYIRNEEHYARVRAYIEQNPVSAGLCKSARDWPWGSLGYRNK